MLRLTAVFCIGASLLAQIVGCQKKSTVVPEHMHMSQWSEGKAVEISRGALESLGYDTKQMLPAEYHDGKIFARNHLDPQAGYVLWKFVTSPHLHNLTVYMNQTQNGVGCKVVNNK